MPDRTTSEVKRTPSPDGLFVIVTTEVRAGRSRRVCQSVRTADGKEVFAPEWGELEYLPDGRLVYTVALRQGGRRAEPYRFRIDPVKRIFCAGSGDSDWRPLAQLTTMLAHDGAQPLAIDLSSQGPKGWSVVGLLFAVACVAATVRFPPEDNDTHLFLIGLGVAMIGFAGWAVAHSWRPR